jgi:hypothetical protein
VDERTGKGDEKMKVIRRSVFETNSSSTHALAIKGGDYKSDRLVVEDSVCRIFPGEFGWGPETHWDAATKAAYCLTHAKSQGDGAHEAMLRIAIQKVTGAASVEFCQSPSEFYEWGYIDHQSIEDNGGVGAEIWESPESIRDFIFNPSSFLVIDNDNH